MKELERRGKLSGEGEKYMSGLILLLIAVILIAAGEGKTVLWVAGAVLVLLVIGSVFGKNKKPSSSEKNRTRIDHPHYISEDEHECPACGARFRKASMVCPHCGIRFTGTRTDDSEYDDELEEELWMDEMDGRRRAVTEDGQEIQAAFESADSVSI